MIEPSTNSTIECTIDCGWITTSIASAGTSNSQRASITSSPLFISVAESIVILRPIRHVGWRSASPAPTRSRCDAASAAERPARRGQDQAPHLAAPPPAQALVDGVVLAVHREDRDAAPSRRLRHQRARPSPALPCWRARSSCRPRSPRAPPRAPRCRTRRRARCPRRGAWPRRRAPRRRARRRIARPRGGDPPSVGPARPPTPSTRCAGRKRSACSTKQRRRSRRRRAPPPRRRSGCASTTDSALCPIEPVDPRMAMRLNTASADAAFTPRTAGTGRRPARRTAARRSDRGRRRARGSAPSCPSRRRSA